MDDSVNLCLCDVGLGQMDWEWAAGYKMGKGEGSSWSLPCAGRMAAHVEQTEMV